MGSIGRCLAWRLNIPRTLGPQVVLSATDQRNHPLVRLLGRLAKGKNAVVQQNHTYRSRVRLQGKFLGAYTRQIKAGHHVGDDDNGVAVDGADSLLAANRIADRQQRIGVRMVHIFKWQDGMQNSLYGRHRRRSAGHMGDHLIDHRRVRQGVQPRQALQMSQLDWRKPLRFDFF